MDKVKAAAVITDLEGGIVITWQMNIDIHL